MTTTVDIPELALVVLVGATGSGKSTFAREHFLPTQVLSSDFFRGLVADDENDQSATGDAFEALHYIAAKRLRAGRLTVVDATNVQKHARASLVKLAREHDVLPVAVVLDTPESLCWERTQARPDRLFGREVVRRQTRELRRSISGLAREGFRKVAVLGPEQLSDVELRYAKLFNDRRDLTGPFDIVGDVHGCAEELSQLLVKLGWELVADAAGRPVDAVHPGGRTAVFVGDLVDRGPDSPGVLRLVMGMIERGHALCVAGNHEAKLAKKLHGREVQVRHGLAETLAQLEADPVDGLPAFLDGLVSHYVLDEGRLVVAHAGLKEEYHGRASGRVRAFAMFGDTTGETDEYGLPVRYPWADDYRGRATVVYGHTPTVEPEWVNNTICLDTGCVFGGTLTALRYPERELVSVPALREHYAPAKPPAAPVPAAARAFELKRVTGRRHVETATGTITVQAEHSAAALEVMSRFAVDPRWLRWLPPTMAPAGTSSVEGYLEHPTSALADYASAGVERVICEEKHMGSRAVVLVCKDRDVAARSFVDDGSTGAVYTRTGRPFFEPGRTEELLGGVRAAVERAGLWDSLGCDWLLLDCELLPWSAKAETLIRQYAAVGAAGRAVLPAALDVVEAARSRGLDVGGLGADLRTRLSEVTAFAEAYRRYVGPPGATTLAPFMVLASSAGGYADRDHGWHLEQADALVAADPGLFTPTRRIVADTRSAEDADRVTAWWRELTESGGEGMVVKPYAGLTARAGRGLHQPGLKVRGREYLRIIYGPGYTAEAQLNRLRGRSLGRKRGLALREHALGLEALRPGTPPWRVHELVFAVLACESEPVDPRL